MVQFKTRLDNFVNKLRFQLQNSNKSSTKPSINNDEQQLETLSPEKVVKTTNFRVKETNSFIEKIEQSIFHPKNGNTKVLHNITKKEKLLRKLKLGKMVV